MVTLKPSSRKPLTTLLVALAFVALPASSVAGDRGALPATIPLPAGFQPEGIEIRGTSFYTGSLVDGAIYRGDVRTGSGRVLVPGAVGRSAFGLELDRRGRLFVAGGAGGGARVLDAKTGAEIASYQFTPAGTGLVHDVLVTPHAAYFTDSSRPFLYRVPIDDDEDGRLGGQDSVTAIALTGDLVYTEAGEACPAAPELNVAGIESSADGRRLILSQLNRGSLFSVDPVTGVARRIDLGGVVLDCSNGIVRRERTLYVAQPPANRVAVVRLGRFPAAAEVTGAISGPGLDFPTAAAVFGPFLYTANARFATEQTPETGYQVVRLPRRDLEGGGYRVR